MTKRIRYLTLLMLFLGSISLWAQDDDPFNPSNPAEPGPSGVPMLSLVADPVDGGTTSGAGWYTPGTKVTLRASNKQNYVFDKWVNANGETISTEAQFKYTKQEGDETLTACFRFSPGSPAEPTEIAQQIYHLLTLVAEDGGTVSGGGKYLPNSRVYLSASLNTGYVFGGWYDEEENLVSSSQNFYYTTLAKPVTLTARFIFSPSSPGEPVTPSFKHRVTVTAEEGGTVNTGGNTLEEGSTIYLSATANTGYVFMGWYVNGELYSAASSFTYTMDEADIAFVARFVFNPSAPGEPSMPTNTKHAFYLMNKVTKPGCSIRYPIYLSNVKTVKDMSFQLTFPSEIQPNTDAVEMSERAVGYTVSCSMGDATDDGVGYVLQLTGGEVTAGNAAVLVFTIPVPNDIATAQNYQVKINQVTVVEEDNIVTTASTRNGRISVYKQGDTNGDDEVNSADVLNIVSVALERSTEVFIKEVSDMDGDDSISSADVLGIVNIVLEK